MCVRECESVRERASLLVRGWDLGWGGGTVDSVRPAEGENSSRQRDPAYEALQTSLERAQSIGDTALAPK